MQKLNLYKIIIQNNRIHHKYIIEKEFESGLVLLGWEVKAIRSKTISIDNSYISFQNKEAYIYNSVFQSKTTNTNPIFNPTRIRKLLLNKKELLFLTEKINNYHYTIVILNLFWKNSWIKANIGLAKGKKKYDKRHILNTNRWKIEKIHITRHFNK